MLGQAEATEYDAHLDNLIQKADRTKLWTEKIVSQTETVLQPNPGMCFPLDILCSYIRFQLNILLNFSHLFYSLNIFGFVKFEFY